jgi:hypothetical protein
VISAVRVIDSDQPSKSSQTCRVCVVRSGKKKEERRKPKNRDGPKYFLETSPSLGFGGRKKK